MRVISIWNPWASLIVHRHKFFETRSWPAPAALIGERIGIAATKSIRPEQLTAYNDPDFQQFYSETGLPELMELPRGCILGTVELHSCEVMTEEFMEEVTEEEKMFGMWMVGHYAWRLRDPKRFRDPIIARGAQGLWSYDDHGVLPIEAHEAGDYSGQSRSASLRPHLQAI